MRIVLTGASGLLGRAFYRELTMANHSVIGCALRRLGPDTRRLDLTEPNSVETFIREQRPDLLVHAAAERRPDRCENDRASAWRLNVNASAQLARLCREQGASMLFVSTDYVFDGTRPPYTPNDSPNPLNAYGQSKYEAEQAVKAALPEAALLRIPILYGRVEKPDECQVGALIRMLRSGARGAIDDWAVRFPTWVDDVACFLRHWTASLEQGEDLSGIWHVSGLEAMSKFGMCQRIAAVLGLNAKGVEPCSEPGGDAPRPRNSQLDCARAQARGWMVSTPFEEAVREVDASIPER